MSSVGRNDPCPCGSGLKFKKCCFTRSAAATESYTSLERGNALSKLMRFARHSDFKLQGQAAFELFWGDWLREEPDEDLERLMSSESVNLALLNWFVFDFELGDGRTVLDRFLAREGDRLRTGERNFLECMRCSHVRLYEIIEVKIDEGFQVRDLWDDRCFWVRERAATRQIVAWDLVVGRIVSGGDGSLVFDMLYYLFPAALKDELLKRLKRARGYLKREFPDKSIADFFKGMPPGFHRLWLEHVALPRPPKLMTTDGEPVIFAKVIFDVLDPSAISSRLAGRDDIIDQGDGSYLWLQPTGASQRSIGAIVVEDRRLVFETTSQKRAEKARDELPGLLGDAVRFRAISYEDVGQAVKRAPSKTAKKEDEIPPEVQAEVLGNFYEQHYRKWIDEPVPALGNRTPRHAARLKTVRPKLIALLKDFESRSERQRRAGVPAYDFVWMWDELKLPRE